MVHLLRHSTSTTTITEDNNDNDGDRLLIQLATDGNVEKVRELLLLRYNSNNKNNNDNNHDEKQINVNAVVAVVINYYDGNSKTTETTTTALIQACRGGHVQVVRELLNDKTIDVNLLNSNGVTALMVACALGHLEIVSELLSWSSLFLLSDDDGDNETQVTVDVNVQDKCYGYTALILASNSAHWDVVQALLKHPNSDANLCCNSGYTALIVASRNGYRAVVRVLLKHHKKVNVNASCNKGRTAFFWACRQGHSDVVCEFLKHNTIVDAGVVNAHDKGGLTPVMVASMKDHLDVVRVLLNDERVDGRAASSVARGACATAWKKRFPNLVNIHTDCDAALIPTVPIRGPLCESKPSKALPRYRALVAGLVARQRPVALER